MAIERLSHAEWRGVCDKCGSVFSTEYHASTNRHNTHEVDMHAKRMLTSRLIRHFRNIHYAEWEDVK